LADPQSVAENRGDLEERAEARIKRGGTVSEVSRSAEAAQRVSMRWKSSSITATAASGMLVPGPKMKDAPARFKSS
jgi:hypothetical protein